jgi:D-amino-acid dehydrogenase
MSLSSPAFGTPRDIDVLVVGAGSVGVCSAWFLRQAGAEVVLVDKGAVCSGSSHGNAGLVVPSHSVPLAEPAALRAGLRYMMSPDSPFYIKPRLDADLLRWLWRFRRAATEARVERAIPLLRDLHLQSRDLYRGFADDGMDFSYGDSGRLNLCDTPEGLAGQEEEAHHMRAAGLEVEILDAAGVAERLGSFEVRCVGAVFYAQDAHMDPGRFVRGLAQRGAEAGVDVVEEAEVLRLLTRGDVIDTVETTRGAFRPRQVVLAAGSWSPGLAADLGVAAPIQPAKGYSVTIEAPPDTPELPLMFSDARVAMTPMGADRVRFAGTLELAGMDLSINQRRVDAIVRAVPRYIPHWDPAAFQIHEVWRGLRPCTPDGLPLLGRPRRWRNAVIAAGHAMIGLSLGPVTGRIVSELVADETPQLDLSLLSPDRFT